MSSANKPLFKVPPPLKTKVSLITNDYDLSQKVLGVGINGKVLECFEKKTRHRFALKVSKATQLLTVARKNIGTVVCRFLMSLGSANSFPSLMVINHL